MAVALSKDTALPHGFGTGEQRLAGADRPGRCQTGRNVGPANRLSSVQHNDPIAVGERQSVAVTADSGTSAPLVNVTAPLTCSLVSTW